MNRWTITGIFGIVFGFVLVSAFSFFIFTGYNRLGNEKNDEDRSQVKYSVIKNGELITHPENDKTLSYKNDEDRVSKFMGEVVYNIDFYYAAACFCDLPPNKKWKMREKTISRSLHFRVACDREDFADVVAEKHFENECYEVFDDYDCEKLRVEIATDQVKTGWEMLNKYEDRRIWYDDEEALREYYADKLALHPLDEKFSPDMPQMQRARYGYPPIGMSKEEKADWYEQCIQYHLEYSKKIKKNPPPMNWGERYDKEGYRLVGSENRLESEWWY